MQDIIIAIDGYSGCGKSSTAKAVAKALDYTYLDSGAMYRAATLYFLKHQVPLHDEKAVEKALEAVNITFGRDEESGNNETYLNGENVEEEIRKMEVSANVSQVSAIPMVRFKMVKQQRALGAARRVVMDGRDIGSHVFPDAELKIFMTADLEVRA
ncbi:MAG: (d)CMP kinase, partial [Cyclobacteriaceae bacterium]